jgi:hypothetical protein
MNYGDGKFVDETTTRIKSKTYLDTAHGEGALFIGDANGDGINDQYWPSVSNVDLYDLKIFDKWGRVLFHSNDPTDPWLGDSIQGASYVANGVYNFLLVCRIDRGKVIERRGHITVIR